MFILRFILHLPYKYKDQFIRLNIIFLSYRQIVFAKNVRQYRYILQACGVSNHFKSKSIMYSKDCILSTVNISIFQFRAWCSHLHRWFVQVEFVFLFNQSLSSSWSDLSPFLSFMSLVSDRERLLLGVRLLLRDADLER